MTCGIYKITCIESGLCYIGQSKQIERRWKRHRKRFPPDLFSYEILLKCDDDVLDFFEKVFIDGYDSHRNGFNKTVGGNGIKSTHPDEETRKKLSLAAQNNSSSWFKEGNPGRTGMSHSRETRQKMSNSQKGRIFSEEHRQKLSDYCKIREQRKRVVR